MKNIPNLTFRITAAITFFLLLFTGTVQGQKTEYLKTYTLAKTEMKNKNFEKAMDLFKKASADKPDNAYKVNAMYFYSYCALKQKMYWSVNHYLDKVIEKYPDWYKIDEVYYLKAQMAYEKKEYTLASMWLQKVKSKFLQKDISNMEWNFLYFPSLKDTVTTLQKKYPTDTTLATILYCLIKDDGGWKNNRLKKNLVDDYKLVDKNKKDDEKKSEDATKSAVQDTIPKDTLNIAVVFPFNLQANIQDNTIKEDQYVYDLYSGMRLAMDSLKLLGAKMRLVAYDYGKDSLGYVNFINNPELRQYDLVVGPLQNPLGSKASKFADSSNTIVINPLSYNSKFIEDTNHVFLFKASVETQTKEAAGFAYKYFKPKKAIILTSKSPKDSLAALLFQKSFEREGGKILNKQTLTAATLTKMNSAFTSKTLDSTGFIFVSTRDQFLGVSIVRKLTELDRTTPLLVYSDWLQFQSISFEQMQKQNIYFIDPDFVNRNNDSTKAVNDYLFGKINTVISDYTFTGYELMWQLGHLWKAKSSLPMPNFLKGLTYRSGFIFKGLDYSKGNDNRCSAIYYLSPEGFREAKLSTSP